MPDHQEIIGVFRRMQHCIPETSFFIGRLDDGNTVVGTAKHDSMIPGLPYRFTGYWQTHQKYGLQFKFDAYCRQEPKTVEQVLCYAKRYIFKAGVGIGPAKMRKMIDHRGPELVLNWLRASPDEVVNLIGISKKNAEKVRQILVELESYESTRIDLLTLFSTHGFPEPLVDVAIDKLGASAVGIIKRDPFTMMVRGWPGCGYQRCNAMYLKLGRPPNKLKRQLMAITYYMMRFGDGSTWFPYPMLVEYLREVCDGNLQPRRVIELGIRSGQLAIFLFGNQLLVGKYESVQDERLIAQHIKRLG